jgi:hypothetical protein
MPPPRGRWTDPVGFNPGGWERKPAVTLPKLDGGFEVVQQVFCNPASWDYLPEEAFAIQLQRCSDPDYLPNLIAMKERELEELQAKYAERQQAGV